MAAEKKEEKKKIPTAQKRMIQNKKRALHNRSFKSRVKTATRSFQTALSGDKSAIQESLNKVISLMDKGVKLKIYKKNKAARIKSKMAQAATTVAAK